MNEKRLKLILTFLGGMVFAMFFILLAFIVPTKKSIKYIPPKKPKGRLEQISHGMTNR